MHETAERVYNLLYGQRNPLWLIGGIYKPALCGHIISVSELTDRNMMSCCEIKALNRVSRNENGKHIDSFSAYCIHIT